MGQFALYENQNENSKDIYPYFVDVQNDLLDSLNSRVVIPLTPYKYLDDSNVSNLCPKIDLNNENFVLQTHQMTSIPCSELSSPITSIEYLRQEIVSAIDFLITGI